MTIEINPFAVLVYVIVGLVSVCMFRLGFKDCHGDKNEGSVFAFLCWPSCIPVMVVVFIGRRLGFNI